jgi:hypothetical protein
MRGLCRQMGEEKSLTPMRNSSGVSGEQAGILGSLLNLISKFTSCLMLAELVAFPLEEGAEVMNRL